MSSDDDLYATVKRSKSGAAFYGQWLIRAAEVQKLIVALRESNEQNPALERLDSSCILDIELDALQMVATIVKQRKILVAMTSYEAEVLALLSLLEFVKLCGNSYVLSLPGAIGIANIERALAALVNTGDDGCMLHPCHLLTCKTPPKPSLTSASLASGW